MAPFTELALAIIAFLGSVNFIVFAAPSVTLTIAAAGDPRTVEHELLHIAQGRYPDVAMAILRSLTEKRP